MIKLNYGKLVLLQVFDLSLSEIGSVHAVANAANVTRQQWIDNGYWCSPVEYVQEPRHAYVFQVYEIYRPREYGPTKPEVSE